MTVTPLDLAQVEIQPATWRDLREVIALEQAAFGRDAWPWIDVLAALTFPETVRLKASRDGKLIGAVFGDRRRHENLGWIASLAVHPTLQRRGVGRLLLAACEQALAMPRIRLTLRRSNERARHLYDRAGYVLTDVWQRYYRNGEDGLVMEKDWSAGSVEAG